MGPLRQPRPPGTASARGGEVSATPAPTTIPPTMASWGRILGSGTQNGLLSFSYSMNGGAYVPVITSQSITASNGSLPATLRFGFAGSTGGDTNVHEIVCVKAAPSNVSASSETVNEHQT